MSLENDITGILESFTLSEGVSKAKKDFVDTGMISPVQFKALVKKDPTEKKKAIEWICKMFSKGHRSRRQYDSVADFYELVDQKKMPDSDINSYKSPELLTDAIVRARQLQVEKEESRTERMVRSLLTTHDGNVHLVYKIVNGKERPGGQGKNIPEDYIEDLQLRMAKEKKGIFGETIIIDHKILDEIDPADISYDNKYVIIVKPTTIEKAQLYGRNHLHNPDDPNSHDSFHCISFKQYQNRFAGYYQNDGDTFWFVLPKDAKYVPDKKYTKICIQVSAKGRGERRTVWDWTDATMSDEKADWLFKKWHIPWNDDEEDEKGDE